MLAVRRHLCRPGDTQGRRRALRAAEDDLYPANVEAVVQLPQRDRPDLLAPGTRALIQPPGGQVAAQALKTSACPTPIAASVAVENAPVSVSDDFFFDGPE